jgi:hypothetical protein
MKLPIVAVAISGLRLLRAQPRLFLWWGGLQLLVGIATFPFVSSLQAELLSERPPEEMMHTFTMLIPFWIASIVLWTVLFGATFRALLAPEDGRFGYLRIGMDELRLFVTLVVLYLVLYVAILLLALVLAIVLLLPLGLIFSGDQQAAKGAVAIGIFIIGLAILSASGWLTARLILAMPLALEGRWCAYRSAWRLSQGNGWRLFGAWALSALISVVVMLPAILIVYLPILRGGSVTALADPREIVAMQTQMVWLSLPIGAVTMPVYLALVGTPIAAALVLLRGGEREEAVPA